MRCDGYNLYALGPPGTGKRTIICDYLQKRAQHEPRPSDWCYVNNFADAQKPRGVALPPGRGKQLKQDMKQLVEDLQASIPAASLRETSARKSGRSSSHRCTRAWHR